MDLIIRAKIVEHEVLLKLVTELREGGKTIVFTNGCFDIIHSGHVTYLASAKALGDILIVGINSDSSIKRLKGQNRPINNEEDRCLVVASLLATDYVIVFDEDTPYNLINLIKPDVLVKGGDWPVDTIVGFDIVKSYSGKVLSLPYVPGKSTTGILSRLSDADSASVTDRDLDMRGSDERARQ